MCMRHLSQVAYCIGVDLWFSDDGLRYCWQLELCACQGRRTSVRMPGCAVSCGSAMACCLQAAQQLKQQYLGEFMSTRLGSQKKAEVLSARERFDDGRMYYDIEVNARLSTRCLSGCLQQFGDAGMQLGELGASWQMYCTCTHRSSVPRPMHSSCMLRGGIWSCSMTYFLVIRITTNAQMGKERQIAQKLRAAGRRGVQMRAQSFASRSPLAQTQAEIDSTFVMEWDRRLLFTLGVANRRLYELRLQAPEAKFEDNEVHTLVLPAPPPACPLPSIRPACLPA